MCHCASPVCGVCCFAFGVLSVSLPALWNEKRANGATVGDAGTGDPRRRPPGGGCGAGAVCRLLARRPVRRGMLATAAKILFQVDVAETLAPAVLWDAALNIARRLHGTPAQAFIPEGTPNVKPPGQRTCARTSGGWCTN